MQATVISFVIPAFSFFVSGAFCWFWLNYPTKQRLLWFAIANAMLAIGFLLILIGYHYFGRQQILVLSAVFNTSAIFFCIAKLQHFRIRPPVKTLVCVGVAGTACIGLSQWLGGTIANELFIANSTIGLLYAFSALLVGQQPIKSLPNRLLMGIMLFVAVQSFLRPAFAFMFDSAIFPEASTDPLFHIALGGLLSILGLTLLLIVAMAQYQEDLRIAKREASMDGLSGLSSRKLFEENVRKLMSKRQPKPAASALIICDIDNFKSINDTYGHQTGDAAISALGKLILSSTRSNDVLGRIGGEEFCIFLTDIEPEVAVSLADRIRRSLTALPVAGLDRETFLSASFGVASQLENESYEQIFARADAALYCAKKLGRNRVELCEKNSQHEPTQSVVKLNAA